MSLNKEELVKKAEGMKLSELKQRIEEILRIFQSNKDNVIDELIPLSEEVKILKQESDKRLGDLESYIENKS